jgi:hypothetical protein
MTDLAIYCIYTMQHSKKLEVQAVQAGSRTLEERARRQGQAMAPRSSSAEKSSGPRARVSKLRHSFQRLFPIGVAVLSVWALSIIGPSPAVAGAASLPRLFRTEVFRESSTHDLFGVRPRSVLTDSADGGELVIHWRTWTMSSASGRGRAYPDHGSYPISVRASRPITGYFTRLTVTGFPAGRWHRDQLALGYLGGISLTWINLSWMRNPASGSTPWPR